MKGNKIIYTNETTMAPSLNIIFAWNKQMFSLESIQPAQPAAMMKRKASGRKFVQSFMPSSKQLYLSTQTVFNPICNWFANFYSCSSACEHLQSTHQDSKLVTAFAELQSNDHCCSPLQSSEHHCDIMCDIPYSSYPLCSWFWGWPTLDSNKKTFEPHLQVAPVPNVY